MGSLAPRRRRAGSAASRAPPVRVGSARLDADGDLYRGGCRRARRGGRGGCRAGSGLYGGTAGRDLLLRVVRHAAPRRGSGCTGVRASTSRRSAIGSTYYPARGPYSSGDRALVRAQMREIAATGIDTVIVSWWGPGSIEDKRLRPVAAEARKAGLESRSTSSRGRGRTPAGGRPGAGQAARPRDPRRLRLRLDPSTRTRSWRAALASRARRAGVRAHDAARQGAEGRLPGALHL